MRAKVFDIALWDARRSPGRLDERAHFLCGYGVHIGVDNYDEAAFLLEETCRISGRPRLALLVADEFHSFALSADPANLQRISVGVAARTDATDDKLSAAFSMMEVLFEARVGFGWPTRCHEEGLIDRGTFAALVRRLSRRLSARAAKAKKWAEAPIVRAAERARLMPEPDARGRSFWRANCPERQHFIEIDAKAGIFRCGYCQVRGGPTVLEELAFERQWGDHPE